MTRLGGLRQDDELAQRGALHSGELRGFEPEAQRSDDADAT